MGILKGQTSGDISKRVHEKLCLPLYELSDSEGLRGMWVSLPFHHQVPVPVYIRP